MSAIEDRERAVLIDLSHAESSADAVRKLENNLAQAANILGPGQLIDINTGNLLLTPGMLARMQTLLKSYGVRIETLYSAVPQTQQSALDEGFFVRRQPMEAPKRFDSTAFMAEAYKELDLPFENLSPPVLTPKPFASKPEPAIAAAAAPKVTVLPQTAAKLSVTLDDGTRQAVRHLADETKETVYYRHTLRSGQVLEAKGNVIVVGDAHSGSEILADGDILVWGFLGGIAHAGRSGDERCEIRAVRIEAVQLRIAQHIARRPDRLFKQGREKHRAPEVAMVRNGEIQIYEDILERA